MTAADWMDRAACRGLDTNLFYTDSRADQAKQVCADCPVRPECLAYVQAVQPPGSWDHGVWGGTDKAERARMRGVSPRATRSLTEADVRHAHRRAQRDGVTKVAAELGFTRETLSRTWKRYGLAPPIEPHRAPRPRRQAGAA